MRQSDTNKSCFDMALLWWLHLTPPSLPPSLLRLRHLLLRCLCGSDQRRLGCGSRDRRLVVCSSRCAGKEGRGKGGKQGGEGGREGGKDGRINHCLGCGCRDRRLVSSCALADAQVREERREGGRNRGDKEELSLSLVEAECG